MSKLQAKQAQSIQTQVNNQAASQHSCQSTLPTQHSCYLAPATPALVLGSIHHLGGYLVAAQ